MHPNRIRRALLARSLGGLLSLSLPLQQARAQAILAKRLPWSAFVLGPDYASFRTGFNVMRGNPDPTSVFSLTFWTNIHLNTCPHGIAYFLGWHRGYLQYFEKYLRLAAGNPNLNLPYWDYYTTPTLPAEFTDPASDNAFYVPRLNNNVAAALTLAPFSDSLTALQRGQPGAFESSVEGAPHNPVHDIIGGWMADMQSPQDPIFWLHHANIDRLWAAWVLTANGRLMPAYNDAYWDGAFTYSANLSMVRRNAYTTRDTLLYYYADETLPTALPIVNAGARSSAGKPARKRPPTGPFPATGMRQRSAARLSLSGASLVGLDRNSVSASLAMTGAAHAILKKVLGKYLSSPFAAAEPSAPPYSRIEIVLEQPAALAAGLQGGYYYQLYLNLPADPAGVADDTPYYLGTLGPFQLAGLRHHAQMGHAVAPLTYPATTLLQRFRADDLSALTLSFVRVDGASTPDGQVISIGECHIDAVTDAG